MKLTIANFLIRLGHRLRYTKESYSEEDYCVTHYKDGYIEHSGRCRFCGEETQTTDRICWKCRK